jgi:CIC family chloride channel protein
MMRPASGVLPAATSLAEARRRFPLGSARQVVLLDQAGAYAGLLTVAGLHAEGQTAQTAGELAEHADAALAPDMTVKQIMEAFDQTEADELVVVDAKGVPLGVLSEAHATRRYAEELEKSRRDLIGES